VTAGRFRKDLLYRLQGVCLTVPPLRERGRDMVRLARHFVTRASGGRACLSSCSEAEILEYSWPGNVREMEQQMKRAVVLAETNVIEWRRPKPSVAEPSASVALSPQIPLHTALGGFERTLLQSALARSPGRAEAARLLGISRQALHQKIVRHGL
jgi:DNA-binding NtrC family response regulator